MNKRGQEELRQAIRVLMPAVDTGKLYSVYCNDVCCKPKKDALMLVCAFLNDDPYGTASAQGECSTGQSAPQSFLARLYWRLFPMKGVPSPVDGVERSVELKPRRFLGWVVR